MRDNTIKQCTQCYKEKTLDQYNMRNKSVPSRGYHPACKACKALADKKPRKGEMALSSALFIAANNYISGSKVWNKPIIISSVPSYIMRAVM